MDFESSMVNKLDILLVSSTIFCINLEKYKQKTVYNLSSTIFTNHNYGTGPPTLGTMYKNEYMFNLLETQINLCKIYFNYLYYILTQILPTLGCLIILF